MSELYAYARMARLSIQEYHHLREKLNGYRGALGLSVSKQDSTAEGTIYVMK